MKSTINPTNYTAHLHPGKFELESPATEYYYTQMLNGDSETVFADNGDSDHDYELTASAELFHINASESEAFSLPIGHWFLLREDSQGFVYGTTHATREQAEQKFQSWIS